MDWPDEQYAAQDDPQTTVVGLMSDTHGILDKRVLQAFRDAKVDYILHAGDVADKPNRLNIDQIRAQLEEIAPTLIVRGNNDDRWTPTHELPTRVVLSAGRARFFVHHGDEEDAIANPLNALRPKGGWKRGDVIVSGHSHRPLFARYAPNGVLFINPGSAGPSRFNLPRRFSVVTVETATINGIEASRMSVSDWDFSIKDRDPAVVEDPWIPKDFELFDSRGVPMKGHAPIKKPVPHTPGEKMKHNANFNPRDPCLDEFEEEVPIEVDGNMIDDAVDDADDAVDDAGWDEGRRRRILSAPPRTVEAWEARWEKRFSCWWSRTPLQEQLGACIPALSLHLGGRLQSAWHTTQLSLGRSPRAKRPPAQLPEGCEWIGEREAEIRLPDFPDFPEHFEVPEVIPIPRLPGMRDADMAQGLLEPKGRGLPARGVEPPARGSGRFESTSAADWWSTLALGAGIGACGSAAVATCALTAASLARRARRLSRLQLRQPRLDRG